MNANLDEWNDFISGTFIKATDVSNENEPFICTKAEPFLDNRDGIIRLRTTLEGKGQEYLFDLNKTNAIFLKNSGINKPREVVGKKIYFKKVLVFNPELKKEVDGLRISKVE